LDVSDWDYLKSGGAFSNESVLIGEETDALDVSDLLSGNITEVLADEEMRTNSSMEVDDSVMTFLEEEAEQQKELDDTNNSPSTMETVGRKDVNMTVEEGNNNNKKPDPGSENEDSARVPLYHVEHLEPPTPATWHKPDGSDSSKEVEEDVEESSLEVELRREMESLLRGVSDGYKQMVALVEQYFSVNNMTEKGRLDDFTLIYS